MHIVPTVFISCYNHGDLKGEIYAAEVKNGEAGLDFYKIVTDGSDNAAYIHGIGHLKDQNKLYYTFFRKGLYTCDFNGDNKRPVLLDDPGKHYDELPLHHIFMYIIINNNNKNWIHIAPFRLIDQRAVAHYFIQSGNHYNHFA